MPAPELVILAAAEFRIARRGDTAPPPGVDVGCGADVLRRMSRLWWEEDDGRGALADDEPF